MNRREMLGALAGSVAAGAIPAQARSAGRPNFIVICCDDLGYGDIGATGGQTIKTPNLDRLARQGMTLTDYYAPANLCTPSRAGLLTGRYPIRTGLGWAVIMVDDERGLPLSEVTIAEALKPIYRSALIGKWHLGHNGPSWPPTKHGFDLFYGIPYSHDMLPLNLYEDDGRSLTQLRFEYPRLQQQFCARAERFIEDNRDRPFFLELALSAPHLPNYPYGDFAGSSAAGAYGDSVAEIDSITGRLMATLERLGLERNTLVIFTSDNGPWYEGSTGGLRQRKGGGSYDGGYRVPFIASQPGTIAAGRRSDSIAMGIDLLPTFCAMAGVAPPPHVRLDGLDISAVLTRGAATPHDELVLFADEDVVGIRTQRWKYTIADYFRGGLMSIEGRGYPQLYDMRDPSESYSVASLHPKVTAAMHARLERAAKQFAPLRTRTRSSIYREDVEVHLPKQWRQ